MRSVRHISILLLLLSRIGNAVAFDDEAANALARSRSQNAVRTGKVNPGDAHMGSQVMIPPRPCPRSPFQPPMGIYSNPRHGSECGDDRELQIGLAASRLSLDRRHGNTPGLNRGIERVRWQNPPWIDIDRTWE